MDSQAAITQAFKNLRKQGFIARQSFSCCGSCASSELATYVKELTAAKRARIKGSVFYTKQDAARLREGAEGFYLKYGRIEPSGLDPVGLPTAECGELIRAALQEVGLKVEWDGDPSTCIWVEV